MKKRLICLLLVLLLTACGTGTPEAEQPSVNLYFPTREEFLQQDGAVCSRSASLDAASITFDGLLEEYLNATPPEHGMTLLPAQWTLREASLETSTAYLTLGGLPMNGVRSSLTVACLTMTLLQLDSVQRVSLTLPGAEEPLLLTAASIQLQDTGMLPQQEILSLYFPDAERRYLSRETRAVEVMDEAAKPAYLVQQLLDNGDSCIPTGTRLLDISVENGVCTVNLSSHFQRVAADGFACERMAVYSIVNSLTELPEITTVDLWVAGAPLEKLGLLELGEGLVRDESLLSFSADRNAEDMTLYPTCGDSGLLVPIPQRLDVDPAQQTPELLLSALIAYQGRNGVRSCIPEGTKLLSLRLEDGTCMIDLTGEFLRGCKDVAEETMAVRSLVTTMCSLPEIHSVEIFVEGLEPNYRDSRLRNVHTPSDSWIAP